MPTLLAGLLLWTSTAEAAAALALTPKPPLLQHARRGALVNCCAADEGPAIDSRGFVVPQVGDVVKMPSKWPGEWDVGQVDFVQFVGSRGAYEVDLLPLKPIGSDLYCMPGKRPPAVHLDVGKLGRLPSEYVPERDAYRVNPDDLEPLGGRKQEDPDVTALGLAEYDELKAGLLREAVLLGLAGSVASLPFFGFDVAAAYAGGSVAGCFYLLALQRETEALSGGGGMNKLVSALVGGRLALPAVVLAVIASRGLAANGGQASLNMVPREQFAAVVLGFLAYKAPLLIRQIITALKELAEGDDDVPLTAGAMPTGSLGVMAKVVQANVRSRKGASGETVASVGLNSKLVVVSGPSGVGKSTLIAKLLAESPARYGFSVSSTTRPPRVGEADGVDYSFLSDARFDEMVENDQFVEWAMVGGQRYGTSVGAIEQVMTSGKVCLLDLDVQGVQSLADRPNLEPFCIWIAPPSLDALRARLRGRGTEESREIEKRISRATEEIEFSLTARCFDKIILNEDLDQAYTDLKAAVDMAIQP